ncbi:MAG: hypothetical protein ACK56I_03490 [bacterium]
MNSSPILPSAFDEILCYLYNEINNSENQQQWNRHIVNLIHIHDVDGPAPPDEQDDGAEQVVAGRQQHRVQHAQKREAHAVHAEHQEVQQVQQVTQQVQHDAHVQQVKRMVFLLVFLEVAFVFCEVVVIVDCLY